MSQHKKRSPAPLTLGGLLEPVTEDEFLKTYWNKAFLHLKGVEGRFETLLPWHALNRLLAQHRLDEPRIRIVKEGQTLPASSFIEHVPYRRGPRKFPRIVPEALTTYLRDGATLIVDSVDEVHEPLTELVENLERKLGLSVQVNAYAGWRSSHGFDLHWDPHDVIVMQLFGNKEWKLYPSTRPYPLGNDIEENEARLPTPVWEGILQSGDLLYIPRGVWHVAIPLNEPTLHLTLGFAAVTGVDLLNWLTGRLRSNEVVRKDLPRFASREERQQYLTQLRTAIDQIWSGEVLDDYLAYCDDMASPRPKFTLPLSATPDIFSSRSLAISLKWNAARTSGIPKHTEDSLTLKANGREWEFAPAAATVLDMLSDGEDHTIAEICERTKDLVSESRLFELLRILLENGLIIVSQTT